MAGFPPIAEDDEKRGAMGPQGYTVGSAGLEKTIAPGGSEEFLFVLSWYVPNRFKGWFPNDHPGQTMKNYMPPI